MKRLQILFANQAFGVCARLSKQIGVSTGSVRKFFIYSSFLTLGSPVIAYLAIAFFMNFGSHIRRRRSVWDV